MIVIKVKNLFKRLWKNLFSDAPVKKNTQKITSSGYYLLECWNQYAELPAAILPYVDRVKPKADWEALGFLLEVNRLGQIRKIKIANRYFSFIPVNPLHGIELEAIKTSRRLTQNPHHIQLLVAQGSKPDEFLHFPATLKKAAKAESLLIA